VRARVSLGNVRVGTLERRREGVAPGGGITIFRFDERYLEMPERPVLGSWFEDHIGPSLELREHGASLPSFFQNYLPERHSVLRELLAERAGVKPHWELELLTALGIDLPGAVVVVPETDEGEVVEPPKSDKPPPRDPVLRFSLAGMQLKFSVIEHAARLTIPARGVDGRWIVKLPDRRYDAVPENEVAMLTWAKAAGLDVPEFRLQPIEDIDGLPESLSYNGKLALAVRRYDRVDNARIHQEDFAQVLGVRSTRKYGEEARVGGATLLRLVHHLSARREDEDELLRRLVFTVLSGNTDGHLKNWSLIYPDGMRPRLSPAYDLLFTIDYLPKESRRLALSIGGAKDFYAVTADHFAVMAERAGTDPSHARKVASEAAERMRDAWGVCSESLPLTKTRRAALNRHLDRLSLR
jgi:serine/threonine-protein kinase HipA